MQIVKGNFGSCYTSYLRSISILKDNEICIYNKDVNDDKLYARSYKYMILNQTIITDRELNIKHDRVNRKLIKII